MAADPGLFALPRAAWVRKPKAALAAETLVKGRPLVPLIRQLLGQRGYQTPAEVSDFLNPKLASLADPFDLPEMDIAVKRIFEAVDQQQKVVLYGDYDVDGVTSMSIIHLTLKAYGLDSKLFLPHRMEERRSLINITPRRRNEKRKLMLPAVQ